MIEEILLTDADRELAKSAADELGVLRKSFTEGDGNLASQLGEIAVCRYLDVDYGNNSFEFDLIYGVNTIDVKTRRCTSKPRENYLVGITTCTRKQECDIYVFARVLAPEHTHCWLVGWLPQDTFLEYATFFKKGDIDPWGNGVWTFKEDGYQLPISELYSMKKLKDASRKTATQI